MDTVKELEQLDEMTTHSLEATLKNDQNIKSSTKKPKPVIQPIQNMVQLPKP